MKNTDKQIVCRAGAKIYIFCPSGYATGGPEALHQLGHHLRLLGFDAYMYYLKMPGSKNVTHENYIPYQVPVTTVVENKAEHVMILPETYLLPIFNKKFSSVRKVIWWLSVTNYHIFQKNYIDKISRKPFFKIRKAVSDLKIASFERIIQEGVLSIGHSWFSMVTLRENGIEPVGQISDYMNEAFYQLANPAAVKEDIIIYNPKKNDEFLTEIINGTSQYNWKPLQDMTPQEVAGWMNKAKLYVDFGYHPGKERMPREACIMRCCMIIGKTGSAAHQPDMPIPEQYRFEKDKEQIPGIIDRIKECLTKYDELINDFKPYREALYREEERFKADIQKIFVKA